MGYKLFCWLLLKECRAANSSSWSSVNGDVPSGPVIPLHQSSGWAISANNLREVGAIWMIALACGELGGNCSSSWIMKSLSELWLSLMMTVGIDVWNGWACCKYYVVALAWDASREMIVLAYGADRMFNLPHRGLSRQAMYGQQLMMRGWYCVSVALKVESRGCLIQCHIGDNHDGVNAFGLSMNEY